MAKVTQRIEIDVDGTVTIEAVGFKGKACEEDFITKVAKAVFTVKKDEATADRRKDRPVEDVQIARGRG